jgi:hypothetical protein
MIKCIFDGNEKIRGDKMSWKDKAKDSLNGHFVKFSDQAVHKVKFLAEQPPRKFPTRDGKEAVSYEFSVEVNSQQKIMSVSSKRLLKKLIAEDDKEPLIGRTLTIKAVGDGQETGRGSP